MSKEHEPITLEEIREHDALEKQEAETAAKDRAALESMSAEELLDAEIQTSTDHNNAFAAYMKTKCYAAEEASRAAMNTATKENRIRSILSSRRHIRSIQQVIEDERAGRKSKTQKNIERYG